MALFFFLSLFSSAFPLQEKPEAVVKRLTLVRASLYQLQDEELQGEYANYTHLYLADETPERVRGMAEMTLIRLADVLDQPPHVRAQLAARKAEEGRAAAAERRREEERGEEARQERRQQQQMNRAAFEAWAPLWRGVHARPMADILEGSSARALAKRLQNRAELRLAVLAPGQVRAMHPSNFTAMGTTGLSPTELRAIYHALEVSAVTNASAVQYMGMLQGKIKQLPPYEPEVVPSLDELEEEPDGQDASGESEGTNEDGDEP